MKLSKAIEIAKAIIQTGEYEGDPDDSDAIIMLIEAGKEVKRLRPHIHYHVQQLLPGETEE